MAGGCPGQVTCCRSQESYGAEVPAVVRPWVPFEAEERGYGRGTRHQRAGRARRPPRDPTNQPLLRCPAPSSRTQAGRPGRRRRTWGLASSGTARRAGLARVDAALGPRITARFPPPLDVYIPVAVAAAAGRAGHGGGGDEPQGPRAALPFLHRAHPLQPAGAQCPGRDSPSAAAGPNATAGSRPPPAPRGAGGARGTGRRALRLLLLLWAPRRAPQARGGGSRAR